MTPYTSYVIVLQGQDHVRYTTSSRMFKQLVSVVRRVVACSLSFAASPQSSRGEQLRCYFAKSASSGNVLVQSLCLC